MTTPTLFPTSELVAQAWISSIPDMVAQVGEQLPADNTTWASTGFVAVAVVGGNPDVDVPIKKPVIQLDCWAASHGSNKPPWQQAAVLAEQIRAACYDKTLAHFARPLLINVNGVVYPSANCLTVYVLTEPHRIYDDIGDNAGYSMDIALTWRQIT